MCAQTSFGTETNGIGTSLRLLALLAGVVWIHSATAQLVRTVDTPWGESGDVVGRGSIVLRGGIDSHDGQRATHLPKSANYHEALAHPEPVDPDQDVRMGLDAFDYVDPEFSSATRQVVYQTRTLDIWIGDIDPLTGLFVTESGRDLHVDSGVEPLATTMQGPEWGRCGAGVSVYYTKRDRRIPQHFRATLENGDITTAQLTNDSMPRRTVLPSNDADSESVQLLYLRGPVGRASWSAMDEAFPESELVMADVNGGISGPRWIPATDLFAYLREVDGAKEIAVTDAVDGHTEILTSDGTNKIEVFPFRAPEFDNEVLFLANIDMQQIGVYREADDGSFVQIMTIAPPETARHKYMFSIEPLIAGARTYFILEMHRSRALYLSVDSSIWIFDMNDDPETRLAKRLDDGTPGYRLEAEYMTGTNEVFVYYSQLDLAGRWQLHRTRTGIHPQNPSAPSDLDGDGDVDDDDFESVVACMQEDLPEEHRAACAACDLNLDGLVDDEDLEIVESCWTGPFGKIGGDCLK